MRKIVILMGSLSDKKHARGVTDVLDGFNINWEIRVASAHKSPERIISLLKNYNKEECIFITIAGRSNALSGMVDGLTPKPVIAAPPYSEKFSGVDLFSSLRMPSGVSPMTVLGPEQAALAAVKIIALGDEDLSESLRQYQEKNKKKLEQADEELQNG